MISRLRRAAARFTERVIARPLLWAMVFGVLLAAPTIFLGLFTDDHILLSVCQAQMEGGREGSAYTRYLSDRTDGLGVASIYSFADGTVEDHQAAVACGFIPWWSIEGVKLRFNGFNFKEFVVDFSATGRTVAEINEKLLKHGIFGGEDLGDDFPELEGCALYAVTEVITRGNIDTLAETLTASLS